MKLFLEILLFVFLPLALICLANEMRVRLAGEREYQILFAQRQRIGDSWRNTFLDYTGRASYDSRGDMLPEQRQRLDFLVGEIQRIAQEMEQCDLPFWRKTRLSKSRC